MSDDNADFAVHKGAILLLLDLHSKQLEKIVEKLEALAEARQKQMEAITSRIDSLEDKLGNIDSGLFLAKKGAGALLAEGLKIATAIFTAYLLIRFGLGK